jgi:hypothetical protein
MSCLAAGWNNFYFGMGEGIVVCVFQQEGFNVCRVGGKKAVDKIFKI